MTEEKRREEEDPLLNYKSFFLLKNFDDTDAISCVAVGDIHIVRICELLLNVRPLELMEESYTK